MPDAAWDLPADPQAVAKARQAAREAVADWGMPELADDVALLVSELVTNALMHAAPAFELSLHARGQILRAEVADHGEQWTVSPPSFGDFDDEHGRGLAIVDAYADRWGVDPAGDGKIVWFLLGAAP